LTDSRDRWASRAGFILATISSAVGLGSIWKFPYELGTNGGGMFLLLYVLGLVLVVGPLMLAELAIGRRGGRDATLSMSSIARQNNASPRWGAVGGLGVLVTSLVLSYYSVIGGWAIYYAAETALSGLPPGGAHGIQAHFDGFLRSPGLTFFFHLLFMAMVAGIVGRGIAGGIEVAVKILMPVMLALLLGLAGYSLIAGDAAAGLRFMFVPDLDRLSQAAVLEALGLGFFSIGVGFATMMTYAAYADRGMHLGQVAALTLVSDTAISLLAGLAVFPLVFAHGLDPKSGPALVFVTLPLAFADMPLGRAAAVAFFTCLAAAAIGSAISMLEMPVAYLCRKLGWSRPKATAVSAILCALAGGATVLSFSHWESWKPLGFLQSLHAASLFDLVDGAATNVLLPVAGIGISLFAGFILPGRALAEELTITARTARLLSFALRYVVPVLIVVAALRSMLPQA
jgi:NSS family neurotransmitter:Na+ symporter